MASCEDVKFYMNARVLRKLDNYLGTWKGLLVIDTKLHRQCLGELTAQNLLYFQFHQNGKPKLFPIIIRQPD